MASNASAYALILFRAFISCGLAGFLSGVAIGWTADRVWLASRSFAHSGVVRYSNLTRVSLGDSGHQNASMVMSERYQSFNGGMFSSHTPASCSALVNRIAVLNGLTRPVPAL